MDGGQITGIIIVAIVMLGVVLKSIFRGPRHPVIFNDGQAKLENQRLREEVSDLKERLKVIERITVDKENSLAKEIESLRDR
jgi:hypothetical protein